MTAASQTKSHKPRRDPQDSVSFDVSDADRRLIRNIIDRTAAKAKEFGAPINKMTMIMDLTATHANGCPLRLADLLAADDFNLFHDVFGISRHINRNTGKLENCFLPRFRVKSAA